MYVCVPIACPRSLHPSVRMLSGCRIVASFVNMVFCCVDMCVRGAVSSCVFCWLSLIPIGLPSSSKRLMNHSTSCSLRNRFVSSMYELVWTGDVCVGILSRDEFFVYLF